MTRARPSDQALAVPAGPVARPSPSGFDSSRISEMLSDVDVKFLEPFVKKAADNFYCQVLDSIDGYLLENLDHNLKSHLAMLERENQRMRTELWNIDRKLGALPVPDRLEAIGQLETASRRYYELLYAVSRKHDGEERFETALRYIRERDSDGSPQGGNAEERSHAKHDSAGPKGHRPALSQGGD